VLGSNRRLPAVLCATSAFSALAALVLSVPAQADLVSVGNCDNSALTRPFTRWADFDLYKLAPGGDFEGSLSGWSLQGGAGPVSGSESFGVSGSVGSASLSLPAGAIATSPPTCVNAAYPTFRLFTRSDRPGTMVAVSVVYTTAAGTATIPVGSVLAQSSWEPSLPMLTGSALAGVLGGGSANVSLRFTAHGGAAQIDDVYVDPWGKG
jgi:hypothetical protein